MSKRALRRHHRRRLFQKRRRYWSSLSDHPRMLRVIAKTPQRCSCVMCSGSAGRKHGEVTLQERAAEMDEEEQISAHIVSAEEK